MEGAIRKISPFIVMDVLARAREIPDAIHMEVGEPDLPPSEKVQEAYIRAIKDRRFFYTPARGLVELREKISEYYLTNYNVKVSPERIIITPGTSGAFLVVFSLLTHKGKRIVLTDPSYPCYKNFIYFLNSEPIFVPIGPETSYKLNKDMIPLQSDAGALMVSSPSNPTGTVYRDEEMKELVEFSQQQGLWFISDEIYHGLVYEGSASTALQFSEDVIVINSFSKYFCMPGLRLGWMILPESLVRKAEVIIQNIFIAANTPAQYAAMEAFDRDYLNGIRETFRLRRDYLYNSLKDIFLIDAHPEGAFYIWADIGRYSLNSMDFSRRLLEESHVAVTPGIDFGSNNTDTHIRLAYTCNMEAIEEGVSRIKDFVERL
ncbi:MAG: aminotransferase class I/II-fold pyridoxal phosphate-dependent enzyme [Nitrospirae bacterium]|nr:aminotransferase class I/II-fold pyridoxal phosphate-dependent enzyme [Nitrospirota bacterium]